MIVALMHQAPIRRQLAVTHTTMKPTTPSRWKALASQ